MRDNASENWGRLLEFCDPDNHLHRPIIPMDMLKSNGLVDVPADAGKGFGIFEELHGLNSGTELSQKLSAELITVRSDLND